MKKQIYILLLLTLTILLVLSYSLYINEKEYNAELLANIMSSNDRFESLSRQSNELSGEPSNEAPNKPLSEKSDNDSKNEAPNKQLLSGKFGNGDNDAKPPCDNSELLNENLKLVSDNSALSAEVASKSEQLDLCLFRKSKESSEVETFDVFQVTDGVGAFTSAVSGNDIDKNYEAELQTIATTSGFAEVQSKYINIWKDELKFAVDNYVQLLKQEDRDAFVEVQKQWDAAIASDFELVTKIISNVDNYGINLGSAYTFASLSEIREAYRKRAMRIKYMTYLIESHGSNPKSPKDSTSLKFKKHKFK